MALGSKAYAAGAESLSLSVSDGWAVFSAIVEAGAFSLAWWQWRQNKHRREEDFIAALFLARSTFATFDGAIKKLLTFILEDAGRRRLGPFSIDRGRNETQLLHRSTVLAAGSAHADALRNLSDYVSAKDRKRIALILDQLAECQFADSDSALLQSAIEGSRIGHETCCPASGLKNSEGITRTTSANQNRPIGVVDRRSQGHRPWPLPIA